MTSRFPIPKWEYQQFFGSEYGGEAQRATERLNELGAAGWELVAALPTPHPASGAIVTVLYVLRRPIPPPQAPPAEVQW